MQNMKRGFSSIVQVTLLTALSVISLFLIWGYVRDLSTDLDTLSPTVDCLIQDSKILNACINSQGIVETNLNVALGEKVFETSDPYQCWDGTYKGKKMNPSVFVYFLNIILTTGEKIEKKGNIGLVR